jgi:hypothetical protein
MLWRDCAVTKIGGSLGTKEKDGISLTHTTPGATIQFAQEINSPSQLIKQQHQRTRTTKHKRGKTREALVALSDKTTDHVHNHHAAYLSRDAFVAVSLQF